MVFTTRNLPEMENPANVKFLGVYLDPGLRWNEHTNYCCGRLGSNIFLLRNLVGCVSPAVVRQAYFSLCHSLIGYAIMAWGHSSGAAEVFRMQRRAVRILAGLHYRADCRSAFINLKILTLPSLFILENLVYIRKHLDEYEKHEDMHSYNTRNKHNLIPAYRRLERCRNGPSCLAIQFYNRVPDNFKSLSEQKYKEQIKAFLINKAFYSVEEYLQCEF